MHDEKESASEKEWRDFRAMLFAMHPSEAKAIMEALEAAEESNRMVAGADGLFEFAPELSDEELEDYQPFSAEEVEKTIDLLKRFGVAMEE